MEPDQNSQNQMPSESSFQQTSPSVSFPTVGTPKKSGGPKSLLIIGILILVGILGFVIFKSATGKDESLSTEPTPFDNLTAPVDETTQVATSTPVSTATPKPADKSAVSIEIQNGTGITGEAAYLQTQLKNLGYDDIKVGNAASTNATATTVTFGSSVASAIVTEITQKLNSIYTTVTTKTGTATTDILIVTGLRKGATVKPSSIPSATGTPKPSTSPSPTPVSTP